MPLIKEYAWAIDLQICVFPQEGLLNNPGTDELMVESLRRGCRAVGGAPYVDSDPHGQIDRIFELAREYDIDIDMHLDFGPTADGMDLEHVCKRTEEFQLWRPRRHRPRHQGGKPADAGIRRDGEAARRMPASRSRCCRRPISSSWAAATRTTTMSRAASCPRTSSCITASIARCRATTSSIRSRRYGDCSQMRMANLYANICQVGKKADMRECFDMVTRRPAQMMRLTDYGLAVGKSADLVVLDSDKPGHGRGRADSGALCLQARPQDRVAGARDPAPAAMIPNDPYNAFCRHTHVELDGASDGPLRGLTFAVKDVFDIAGHRTGNGNPVWLATHAPAARTASAVERLLAAGARVVGKTHTDELAYSLNGENVHYGTPTNPRAPGRIPGGSSSGSAAAVAGGLVDFALGTDCGGSVRLPASYCGIYGIRTSHGLVPADGVV